MTPPCFPLRWESTGDQWWYASPIDWAAANGLYDLILELLHLDTNLLIKLTSLRRIRRLETVWDDDDDAAGFGNVAKCRAYVSRRLLHECEATDGQNSLIRAGYGGWLLYTAASAGDMAFVKELLERDALLVFGEGEYGVTDIFYAAARSKDSEVFRVVMELAVSWGGTREDRDGLFEREMKNRAVHAAASGGNLEVLREVIGSSDGVLGLTDLDGSTVLHTAAATGKVEVVKELVASYSKIITCTDNQVNTALHLAAYKGHLPVVLLLLQESPSLARMTNKYGDTFLHTAVAGFRMPGFHRVDRQVELVRQLVSGDVLAVEEVINMRNKDGRTALHMAVTENIQASLVELLMTAPSIDLNARDANGMTPLDLLRQRPKSVSLEILIKQLIAAGGISKKNALVSQLRGHAIHCSPGTSFTIPDSEIVWYTTSSKSVHEGVSDQESTESGACLSELSEVDHGNLSGKNKLNSETSAARHLKFLLQWTRRGRNSDGTERMECDPLEVISTGRVEGSFDCHTHIPLRQKYSKASLLNNKRVFCSITDLPNPSLSAREKFAAGLTQGVIKATPYFASRLRSSTSSSISVASPISVEEQNGVAVERKHHSDQLCNGSSKQQDTNRKQPSLDKKLMNQCLSFGAQSMTVKGIVRYGTQECSFPHVSS